MYGGCVLSPHSLLMVPRTRIVKIGALLFLQFGLLVTLNSQLCKIVTAYRRWWNWSETFLWLHISKPERHNYIERKDLFRLIVHVHGRSDSLVLFNLVCIEVDVLIFHLSLDICETMNTILYFIFSFLAAAMLFPGKQNRWACRSSLFSPVWSSISITWDFFRFSIRALLRP